MTATTWTGSVSHDWGVVGNWSNGVPDSSDADAVINFGFPEIGVGESVSVGSVSVGSNEVGTFTESGTPTVSGAVTVNKNGKLLLELGTIKGGVLSSSGTFQAIDGTLDGVTYDGVLTLDYDQASLRIRDGLTITGADGTGPGLINLNTGHLTFVGDQTLDNATVDISQDGDQFPVLENTGSGSAPDGFATLTLGSHAAIINTSGQGHVDGQIVNEGLLEAQGGILNIGASGSQNQGTIEAVDGGAVYFRSLLGNFAGTVLTGGVYIVDGSAGAPGGGAGSDSDAAGGGRG